MGSNSHYISFSIEEHAAFKDSDACVNCILFYD